MKPLISVIKTHEIAPLGSRSDSRDALPVRFIRAVIILFKKHVCVMRSGGLRAHRLTCFDRASSDPALLIQPRVLRFKIPRET